MRVHLSILALMAAATMSASVPQADYHSRDIDIEFAAKTSFNFRMVLRSHVLIRVNSGIVTLTGRVEDQTTRSLASETVECYPGVVRVINNINVHSVLKEFSDGWIAQHINLLLLVKKGMNPDTVEATVSRGVVTLRGTAETEEKRELTARYTRSIVGVTDVINLLVVSDDEAARRRWDGPIDDPSITAQFKHAIRDCPEIQAPTIVVSTHAGRMEITGIARHDEEKDRITQLALEVRGSTSVDNQMQTLI